MNADGSGRLQVAPVSSPGEHRESTGEQLSVVDDEPVGVAALELREQPLFSSREFVTDGLMSSRIKRTESDIRRVHVDGEVWRGRSLKNWRGIPFS